MTIQEAVNKAVEGGYHLHGSDGIATVYTGAHSEYSAWTRTDNHSSFMVPVQETFLDPASSASIAITKEQTYGTPAAY